MGGADFNPKWLARHGQVRRQSSMLGKGNRGGSMGLFLQVRCQRS